MPDSAEAQDFNNNQIGSSAAKQQLIEQLDGWENSNVKQTFLNARTYSQGFNGDRGHPFFIQYYDELYNNGLYNSRGYPQNLRKIALVNGSLNGVKNFDVQFSPINGKYANNNEITVNVRGFQHICLPWPRQNECWDVHIASLETYNMPGTNGFGEISRYKKAFNDNSMNVYNYNSRGNMDNVPGGYFDGFTKLVEPVEGTDPIMWQGGFYEYWEDHIFLDEISDLLGGAELTVYKNAQVHSFIPTVSSLGFHSPDFNWTQKLDRNLVCTDEIPFDSYYGPKLNEQHTSFTESSVTWLLAELAGNPQPPTVYIDAADINGPNIMCVNDLVQYSFDECVAPAATWEVSPNLEIETFGSRMVVVKSVDNGQYYNDWGYIKAIFPNHEVQKNIWIGRPDNPENIDGPAVVHIGSVHDYSTSGADGADTYEWALPEPFTITNNINYYGDYWQMHPTASRNNFGVYSGMAGVEGDISVKGQNECGLGNPTYFSVTQTNTGPCPTCYTPIPVYPIPNSASEEFKLDFRTYPEGTYYIYIYDQYSNVIYQGESSNIEKTVTTSNIPNGIYYLHIHTGSTIDMMQLQINH
jgi:hypothetical protein